MSRAALGRLVAFAAATLFGFSAPLLKPIIGRSDPFAVSATLYIASGFVLLAVALLRRASDRALGRAELPFLAGAILCGGLLAPVLSVHGLDLLPAHVASLLFGSETAFTILLAYLFLRERLHGGEVAGIVAVLAGLTIIGASAAHPDSPAGPANIPLGLALTLGAALFWAADNILTRRIAHCDPVHVACAKGLAGGTIALLFAAAGGRPVPALADALTAAAVGSLGFGVSIVMFVYALRWIGAARTAAWFAWFPAWGVLGSYLYLDETIAATALLGGAIMLFGTLALLPVASASSPKAEPRPAPELDLSVLILDLDEHDRTRECVEAVRRSVSRTHEILVLDNGSAAPLGPLEGARVVRSEANLGYAAGINLLARQARGRFLLFLNNDARPEAGAVEEMIRYLETHPQTAAVGPALVRPDGTQARSLVPAPTPLSTLLGAWAASRSVPTLVGAAMMVRGEAWDRIGPFDPRYFVFFEETDWCVRAVRAGWRIERVDSARVWHAQGVTKKRFARRGRLEYVRSRMEYLRAHYPNAGSLLRPLLAVRALLALRPVEAAFLALGCPVGWTIRGAITGYERAGRWWVRLDEPNLRRIAETWETARARGRVVKSLRRKVMIDVDGYRIRILRRPGRARREVWATQETIRRGIATVPIAGWYETGRESVTATRWRDDWVRLDRAAGVDVRAYGAWCRRVHDAGIRQHHFNPTNVLAADGGFRLIDFERTTFGDVDEDARVDALCRMARDVRATRTDRARFLIGYAGREWKAWWRGIAAEYARRRPRWERERLRLLRRDTRNYATLRTGTLCVRYRKADPETGEGGLSEQEAAALLADPGPLNESADTALRRFEDESIRAWLDGGHAPLAVVWDEARGCGRVLSPPCAER